MRMDVLQVMPLLLLNQMQFKQTPLLLMQIVLVAAQVLSLRMYQGVLVLMLTIGRTVQQAHQFLHCLLVIIQLLLLMQMVVRM